LGLEAGLRRQQLNTWLSQVVALAVATAMVAVAALVAIGPRQAWLLHLAAHTP